MLTEGSFRQPSPAEVDQRHLDRNAASLERLRRTVADADEATLGREVEPGWTVGVLLAHQAFWDRFVTTRWQAALAAGRTSPADIPDGLADLVNDAMAPLWRAIPERQAAALAVAAAEETDQVVASLPAAAVEAVISEGRERLVDRSYHRTEHLDAIDRARMAG
jgi:hypothetical protein